MANIGAGAKVSAVLTVKKGEKETPAPTAADLQKLGSKATKEREGKEL